MLSRVEKHQQWSYVGTAVWTRFIQHLRWWSGRRNAAKSSSLMIPSSSSRQWETPEEIYEIEWTKRHQISFTLSKWKALHLEKKNLKCAYMQKLESAFSVQENDLGNIMVSLPKSLVWCSVSAKKSQQNVDQHQERCWKYAREHHFATM